MKLRPTVRLFPDSFSCDQEDFLDLPNISYTFMKESVPESKIIVYDPKKKNVKNALF